MPVKGKLLGTTTYKDISKVYLKDGRTVNAIYAPVNGHYELVYPSYPKHELIDSEYNITQISEMPVFPTNNGSNTFDVGTANKPTKASVPW